MSKEKPGILATIMALIGIAAYTISDLFTYIYLTTLFQEVNNPADVIGQIFVLLVFLGWAVVAVLVGTVFLLLGKIKRQSFIIVLLALLGYSIFLGGLAILTIVIVSSGGGDITSLAVLWLISLAILTLHISGFRNATKN